MKRKALFQLTARISFLIAALLLASGTFSYFFSISKMRDSAFHNNIEVLRQTEYLVSTALGVIVRNAYSAAIHQRVVNAVHSDWDDPEYGPDVARAVNLLRERVSSSYYIHSMCIYSRLNDRVISNSGILPLTRFPDREAVEAFYRSDKMSVWKMTQGNYTGLQGKKPVIGFMIRIPIELNKAPGIMVVNVDEGLLYQTVLAVNQRFLGEIFVLDEEGVIISHGDKAMLSSRFDDVSLPFKEDASVGYLIHDGGTGRSFVSYLTSPYTGWRYVAIKEYSSVVGENRILIIIYIGIAFGFVLVGVVVSIILSRRYYRPIGEIVNQISGITSDTPASKRSGETNEFQYIRSSIRRMSERVEQSRTLLKEHFLIDLLIGHHFDRESLERQLQYYGINMTLHNFIVAILHIHDRDFDHPDDEQLILYTVGAKAEEIIGSRCRGTVINRGWHELALILNFPDTQEEAEAVRIAGDVAVVLSENLSASLDSTVVIGIGGFYADIDEISKSYREALEALRYEGIAGRGAIIRIGDIRHQEFSHAAFTHIETAKERLLKDFKAGRYDTAKEAVELLVRSIMEDDTLNAPFKSAALFSITGAIITEIMNGHSHSKDIPPKDLDPALIFSRMESTETLIDWFRNLIDAGRVPADTAFTTSTTDTADSVEKFLQKNYTEPVDLSLVSERVGFNINYLGRIFKDHTGKTLYEYLTDVRIEAACTLLTETDMQVGEIARETGFSNKRNIARAFKRHLGVTPSRYRTKAALRRLSEKTN